MTGFPPRGRGMRPAPGLLTLCILASGFAGCAENGRLVRSDVKTTETSSPPAASAPTAPPPSSAVDPATTTTTVSGDGPGDKLHEVASDPAPDAGASSATGASHHDPGRSPADIKAIVVAHRDEARACYDVAARDHPDLAGDLVLTWTIDPDGAVTHTAVDESRSQITEPAVVECVSAVIRKIQFAKSPGGYETHATYPFRFHRHTQYPRR